MTLHSSQQNDIPKGLNPQYIQDGQILPFYTFLVSLHLSAVYLWIQDVFVTLHTTEIIPSRPHFLGFMRFISWTLIVIGWIEES